MRQLDVRLSHDAEADLKSIYLSLLEYTGSGALAIGFIRRIRTKCIGIGGAPRAGRVRHDLMEGLRFVSFERKAMIAYRIERDTVVVLNIFWAGRDYEAFYLDDDKQG